VILTGTRIQPRAGPGRARSCAPDRPRCRSTPAGPPYSGWPRPARTRRSSD